MADEWPPRRWATQYEDVDRHGTTVGCPAVEKEEDMRKRGRLEKDEERMPDADPSVDGRRVSRERGDSGEARETLQRFQREEGGRREKMPTKRSRTRK